MAKTIAFIDRRSRDPKYLFPLKYRIRALSAGWCALEEFNTFSQILYKSRLAVGQYSKLFQA